MAEKKEVVFTISYDESGNIVDVEQASGYIIIGPKFFSPKEGLPIESTNILQANTTMIIRTSSSPDCWWIIDPATGQWTKVCR